MEPNHPKWVQLARRWGFCSLSVNGPLPKAMIEKIQAIEAAERELVIRESERTRRKR
jgi:hypothetical protein